MSDKVIFHKYNEVYLQIETEPGIAHELNNFFCFKAPGYQFSPKFRAKIWNGDIHLFSLRKRTLYYGLLDEAIKFCKERNYEVELDLPGNTEFSVLEAEQFIKMLKLPHEVRDFQLNAFVHAIRNHRHVILSPTGSGKSLILYLIFMYLIKDHKKGLIIVPNISLVEQMFKDFKAYSVNNGINMDALIHKIYAGQSKTTDKILTVSTWQSLQKETPDFFEKYDFFMGDEAHLHDAKSLKYIGESCINANYRISCTGSLKDSNTHKMVLEGLFGSVREMTTTKTLIDKKQLSEFEIKCILLKHVPDKTPTTYQEEMEYLITLEARNRFICNLSLSLKGNTLVLFQYVEKHGEILYQMIKNYAPVDRKIFFISGKTDLDTREKIREVIETEKNAIVVASFGTTSTGINIRNLHNVIFASAYKSRVKNLQSIGRVLRLTDDGQGACLYDIADDLRLGTRSKENFTLGHFVTRLKLYVEQKFDYKIYNVDLKI